MLQKMVRFQNIKVIVKLKNKIETEANFKEETSVMYYAYYAYVFYHFLNVRVWASTK